MPFTPPIPPTFAAPAGPARAHACVSVDLDSVDCYWRIHGLPGRPPEGLRSTILRRCLPRFAELFARLGIRATLFVVGRDLLEDPEGRARLAGLASSVAGAGHELANHSHSHFYDLVRRAPATVVEEIERAHQAIGDCAGRPPVGFRAPGYEITSAVLARLCERAYVYDSSAFPAPAYYAAKAAVMAAMRLRGRASGSALGSPRILTAPRAPYRPSAASPYARGDLPIWELPMAVTPGLRLPVIGTSLVLAPEWLRRRLVASVLGSTFLNLELHGIDLADAEADGFPPDLVARQPDLRRSLPHKRAALEATLTQIRAAGFAFGTLAEVSAELARRQPVG
jgi:peptidoglycan/xylan/chitin deacetylase (PgdA/CDA1 family)